MQSNKRKLDTQDQRNKRLFGIVQGTLRQFQQQNAVPSVSSQKQLEISQKLALEKSQAEEEYKKEREKQEADNEMRRAEQVEAFRRQIEAQRLVQHQHLAFFQQTEAYPPLYYKFARE